MTLALAVGGRRDEDVPERIQSISDISACSARGLWEQEPEREGGEQRENRWDHMLRIEIDADSRQRGRVSRVGGEQRIVACNFLSPLVLLPALAVLVRARVDCVSDGV